MYPYIYMQFIGIIFTFIFQVIFLFLIIAGFFSENSTMSVTSAILSLAGYVIFSVILDGNWNYILFIYMCFYILFKINFVFQYLFFSFNDLPLCTCRCSLSSTFRDEKKSIVTRCLNQRLTLEYSIKFNYTFFFFLNLSSIFSTILFQNKKKTIKFLI